jgi:5'-nucleotidase
MPDRLGLDLSAVGNHEFDEGVAELRRMQEGGCHPTDGCQDGTPYRGADFPFLAANVVDEATGEPIFPPYAIRRFQGVRVGFIGLTLEGTPDIVSPAGVAGVDFLDEADAANRYARELERRRGVDAIVVLLHEGAFQVPAGGMNECNGISGPAVDIVGRTTDEVDLFLTGHTHAAYNCEIDGRRVTSAASFGRLITDVDLEIGRRSGEVLEVTAVNRIVTQDVMRAPDMTRLIERYTTLAAPLRDRVIGRLAADATRAPDDSGESSAGNLIADAQLAATDDPGTGGAVAAFMNPGGVRADLAAGEVTYGEAFTVQPLGDSLVTMTLTGAQLLDLLEQQWCEQSFPRLLLPSQGVTYSYSGAAAAAVTGQPCAEAANPVSLLRIGGAPVVADQAYRITVNSFLAEGGDRFGVLRSGTDRLGGPVDTDALEAYLAPTLTGTPLTPPATDRITRTP